MLPCDTCRDRLLDLEYGLLDPAEAAAVDAHLADCPACRAARDEATRARELLGRAAKTGFPDVRFVAPAAAPVEPAASPIEPRRATVRQVWVRWAVAAVLLLTVTGLGGPAARDLIGYYAHKPTVVRELAAVDEARDRRAERQADLARAEAAADRRLAEAEETIHRGRRRLGRRPRKRWPPRSPPGRSRSTSAGRPRPSRVPRTSTNWPSPTSRASRSPPRSPPRSRTPPGRSTSPTRSTRPRPARRPRSRPSGCPPSSGPTPRRRPTCPCTSRPSTRLRVRGRPWPRKSACGSRRTPRS